MKNAVYTTEAAMEPLLPTFGKITLAELSCEIMKESGRLCGQVHSPLVQQQVAGLVREMNCYYSNLIEGHNTLPRDIERALKQDFSADPGKRDNQRLSVSHIAVEARLPSQLKKESVSPYSPEFIYWLHREFYDSLPRELRWAETKSGNRYEIKPGEPRDFMVDVGSHTPPDFRAVPKLLGYFCRRYSSDQILATDRLIAIAAAHHRLAWLHPFGDGNGRVTRLHSQALLIHHGLDGGGYWTLSRGLARSRKKYYELLEAADRERRNDYDGRGNLSDRALSDFCHFFLETMLDQIRFMSTLLDLPQLRERIERYFQYDALHLRRYRMELARVVKVLADEGEIPRARVLEITGKKESVATSIIKIGLAEELFSTPSPKGPLQVSFSSKTLPFYFPSLFIESPI